MKLPCVSLGNIEIDTGYFGGKGNAGANNENLSAVMAKKSAVTIAVERGGKIRAEIVPNAGADTMQSFIERNVESERLMTDNSKICKRLDKTLKQYSVDHHKGEYVRYKVHINTVETFFSHLKRSIKGTFKSISKQHLQSYLDAFVWHHNNRHNDKARFGALLGALLQSSK